MVPDRQKERTDGQNGQTDAQTTQKLNPSDFVGDKKNSSPSEDRISLGINPVRSTVSQG